VYKTCQIPRDHHYYFYYSWSLVVEDDEDDDDDDDTEAYLVPGTRVETIYPPHRPRLAALEYNPQQQQQQQQQQN
jgi:hypothetical protein